MIDRAYTDLEGMQTSTRALFTEAEALPLLCTPLKLPTGTARQEVGHSAARLLNSAPAAQHMVNHSVLSYRYAATLFQTHADYYAHPVPYH